VEQRFSAAWKTPWKGTVSTVPPPATTSTHGLANKRICLGAEMEDEGPF